MDHFSTFLPRWLRIISNPSCQTILFYGCGGGFDFTHSILLIPSLLASNKKVVILSNSFSNVRESYDTAPTYFDDPLSHSPVKLLSPTGVPGGRGYIPEHAFVEFVAERFPGSPVTVYANDVHAISVAGLQQTLSQLITEHSVDVVVTIDGGTDSLMRGDEENYATIIEDFVSLAVLENLRTTTPRLQAAMLLVFGFGVDRFHGASDAASLRAVAELTRMGGFFGASSIDQGSDGFAAYSDFLLFYRNRYSGDGGFQTIVGSMIAAATVGQYGPYQSDVVPKDVPRKFERSGVPASAIQFFNLKESGSESATLNNSRVRSKDGYIWPLMAQVFGFDVAVVMERNLIAPAFRAARNWDEIDAIFRVEAKKLKKVRLLVEDVPRQDQMSRTRRREI